jgi:2-iminobutanoate/2-iminopropanoate deaminase
MRHNISIFAKTNKQMKKVIHTTRAPEAVGPYSQAIETNDMLFISGQIPIDPATGEILKGGIKDQTELVMNNIGAILEAAGYTFNDVVKYTCLLDDMGNFKDMNEVFKRYYPEDPPARATFGVVSLPLGVALEIETIAIK